jgi:hypothetical protein
MVRRAPSLTLLALLLAACGGSSGGNHPDAGPSRRTAGTRGMAMHDVEIVTNDADALIGLYERVHRLSFGPPDPDLGQARRPRPTELSWAFAGPAPRMSGRSKQQRKPVS